MRYIMVAVLLMVTCSAPQPLMQSGNPTVDKINTKVIIRGDSNHVEINYYLIDKDTLIRDSL